MLSCIGKFSYIGQTKRDLKVRISEHQRVVCNQLPRTLALCEHFMTHDHLGNKPKFSKWN